MASITGKWQIWASRRGKPPGLAEQLLACFPGAVMLVDADGVIEQVNPEFEPHAGHASQAMLGRRVTGLDVDPLCGELHRALDACVASQRPWSGVVVCRRADGRQVHQLTHIQPLVGEGPPRLLITQRDVTELNRNTHKARARLERMEDSVAHLPAVVFRARQDAQGRFELISLSNGLPNLGELTPERVLGEGDRLFEWVHRDDRDDFIVAIAQSAVSLDPWQLEFRLCLPRREVWLEGRATARRIRDGGTLWDGLLLDITERKRSERGVEQLVRTDMLTGALSRRAFFAEAESVRARAARQGRRVPLAMLDLDHFKHLNDTHGHSAGDLALQSFAQACRDSLRPYDLFARVGGEEFVVMLIDSEPKQAWGVLDRLRRAVEAIELEVDGVRLKLTVSIGLTLLEPTDSLESALYRADRSLYRAKHRGRNRISAPSELVSSGATKGG